MKNIRSSVKGFIQDHKPEIVSTAIVAGTAAVLLTVKYKMRNYVEITDVMREEMSTGDYTRFIHNGTEYAMALYIYKPPVS